MVQRDQAERIFQEIMRQYDDGYPKDTLYLNLTRKLGLDARISISSQLETILERKLTGAENEKIATFALLRHHGAKKAGGLFFRVMLLLFIVSAVSLVGSSMKLLYAVFAPTEATSPTIVTITREPGVTEVSDLPSVTPRTVTSIPAVGSSTSVPVLSSTSTSIGTPSVTDLPTSSITPTPLSATKVPTDTGTNIPTDTHTPLPTPTFGAITWIALTSQPDVFSNDCPLINDARTYAQFSQGQAGISATLVGNGHTGKGLQLDFTNAYFEGGYYSGWEVWLGADDFSGIDLSSYSSLVFYIRGGAGGEEPNVYLMMPATNDYQRFWKDVELVTPVTTSWNKVEIHLSDFTVGQGPHQQVSLTNIQRIQILFEWYPQPTSGRIFIDDLCVQ